MYKFNNAHIIQSVFVKLDTNTTNQYHQVKNVSYHENLNCVYSNGELNLQLDLGVATIVTLKYKKQARIFKLIKKTQFCLPGFWTTWPKKRKLESKGKKVRAAFQYQYKKELKIFDRLNVIYVQAYQQASLKFKKSNVLQDRDEYQISHISKTDH